VCNGPSSGNNVTFTRPDTYLDDWHGLPDPADAARAVITAYLGAYGPARAETFDAWLTRGASKRGTLREWFESLEGEVIEVEIGSAQMFARACDVDEMNATAPSSAVRLLPAFDQYVLAAGTNDPHILSPPRRSEVSRAGGWISPVVIAAGGRIVGTWGQDISRVVVAPFDEARAVPTAALENEIQRIGRATGTTLTLALDMTSSPSPGA
jgi:hypothetical protein